MSEDTVVVVPPITLVVKLNPAGKLPEVTEYAIVPASGSEATTVILTTAPPATEPIFPALVVHPGKALAVYPKLNTPVDPLASTSKS